MNGHLQEDEHISFQELSLVPCYSDLESRALCNPSLPCYDEDNLASYALPVIASGMDTVYSKRLDRFLTGRKVMVIVHRYYNSAAEQLKAAYKPVSSPWRFFAVGQDRKWITQLAQAGITHFCADFAHGDSKVCIDTVKFIRELVPQADIMAGAVATPGGFQRLEEAGADMIRCGVGCGSICSTRLETGIGVPLVTTLVEVSKVRQHAWILADGGSKHDGDIAKALALGADMVISGRMFAATDLSAGTKFDAKGNVTKDPEKMRWCLYRGMASKEARASIKKAASIEGVEGIIPYYGRTRVYIDELTRHMRGTMSYLGVATLKDLHERFRDRMNIIRVSGGVWEESKTHVQERIYANP